MTGGAGWSSPASCTSATTPTICVVGAIAAAAAARVLSKMLFGVRPTDPSTFALVALALAAVAFMACYLPARRAMRVDPIVALRAE